MYTKNRILYLRGCRVLWDCGGHRLLLILLLPFGVGAIIIFIILLPLCPRSGELRTQKLKSRLVRTRTELKHSPFKAWSRSVYSHTCYAYCHRFLPFLFLPFRSIHLHFSKTTADFSCVGCG